MLKHIDDTPTIQEMTARGLSIIYFGAPWCQPCKALTPQVEQLAGDNQDVTFIKVNVDVNKELSQHYGVRSVPTLIVLKDGEMETAIMMPNRQKIERAIQDYR